MTRLFRGAFIVWVVLRYGLDELLLSSFRQPWLRMAARVVSVGRRLDAPRGVRLRQALERLGPIFVKFGQVLSTRRDLLPIDIADELARLQDRVPPFDSEIAIRSIECAFRKPLGEIFASFEREPVASASIAQVHFAVLIDKHGKQRDVAVKVLRPGMLPAIEKDLSLMRTMASWVGGLSSDGRRLKPREVVAEFDKYLHDELDLVREAFVFQAGTKTLGEDLVTDGGRVLSVTSFGKDIEHAIANTYKSAALVAFEGRMFRSDIGHDLVRKPTLVKGGAS